MKLSCVAAVQPANFEECPKLSRYLLVSTYVEIPLKMCIARGCHVVSVVVVGMI